MALTEADLAAGEQARELVELDDALAQLSARDEQLARLVELRYFGGLTIEETAQALAVSEATVKRNWRKARMFLHRELVGNEDASGAT